MNYNESRLEINYNIGKFKAFDTVEVIKGSKRHKGMLFNYTLKADNEGKAVGYSSVFIFNNKKNFSVDNLITIDKAEDCLKMYHSKCVLIEKDNIETVKMLIVNFQNSIQDLKTQLRRMEINLGVFVEEI